jgi:hypothetical protein
VKELIFGGVGTVSDLVIRSAAELTARGRLRFFGVENAPEKTRQLVEPESQKVFHQTALSEPDTRTSQPVEAGTV